LPFAFDLAGAAHNHCCIWEGISEFIEENAKPGEWAQGRNVEEVYGLIFERVRPGLEKAIQAKEAELDRMLEDFRTLSPKLRERANAKMEALQADIDAIRRKMEDLRVPWGKVQAELTARRKALDNALVILGKQGADRQKTEALRGVIDRIVCHFRYVDQHGKPMPVKSFLESVEIIPVSGEAVTFRSETSPGPG